MKLPNLSQGLAVAALLGANISLNAASALLAAGANVDVSTAYESNVGTQLAYLEDTRQQSPDKLFKATLETWVYDNHPSNPWGLTAITIEYRISNLPDVTTGERAIWGMGIPLLESVKTTGLYVGFRATGTETEIPAIATLDTEGLTIGVAWLPDQIAAGETSMRLVVHTPFTDYKKQPHVVGVIDGGVENFKTLAGFGIIPEPSTYAALFALGLAGFAAYRRVRD